MIIVLIYPIKVIKLNFVNQLLECDRFIVLIAYYAAFINQISLYSHTMCINSQLHILISFTWPKYSHRMWNTGSNIF
jgi:hypothetical protein